MKIKIDCDESMERADLRKEVKKNKEVERERRGRKERRVSKPFYSLCVL